MIKVQLLDDNDNAQAPVFLQPLVELTIEENNAPNAFLTKLDATDADSGREGPSFIFSGT